MLGNWIKTTTTTTGAGALTLASVTGYPAFNDVFGTGRLFFYTILNADGTPVESGLGKLTSSTVMSRTRVLSTYSGGTFTDSNASAVTLGAGPYTVICAADESSFNLPAANVNAILASSNSAYVSGTRYIITADRGRNTSTTSNSSFIYYIPFRLETIADMVSLAMNVTAGSAGVTCNIGLYECDERGAPGSKLAETGPLDFSTSGMKVGTVAGKRLVSGWYFAAYAMSGGASVNAFGTNGFDGITAGNPVGIQGINYSENKSGILLPATPAPNDFATSPAMIYLGVR